MAAGLPFSWAERAITFQEPELPSGAPDVLLLRLKVTDIHGAASLTEHELKLLHFISSRSKARIRNITDLLCWSPKAAAKTVASLAEKQLLSVRGDLLVPSLNAKSLLARDIIAIEAKIGGWKRAIIQAQRNKWFASQSYILLSGTVPAAAKDAAETEGVGILRYGKGRTEVVVRSEKMRLPGSYASWLVSMWGHREAHA
ncbi:hypothetical protein E2F46_15300 [Luteimonas aestuarii]|uniref:Uncharacterized protein n=1 Tax=Luteimonas aestuarii TaxID=453837 RepID=A0A4R5TJ01_9GAMM|nr:hypothetical protein [Luteimonas aestuarii]TDK21064.1 hypothetical protein E2F46_15300 [Luteimonas aestuarii]